MRQRVNIGLVTIFSQAIQITLVGVGLTGFFVLFGFLAIPEDTVAGVDDARPGPRARPFDFGGRELVVTEPLVRVAGFLGRFAAMYFTVVLSTDATYREEFADDVAPSCAKRSPCAASTAGRAATRQLT